MIVLTPFQRLTIEAVVGEDDGSVAREEFVLEGIDTTVCSVCGRKQQEDVG